MTQCMTAAPNYSTAATKSPTTQPSKTVIDKQSWVWNHFDKSIEPGFSICQVTLKRGCVCGTKMKWEKSSSTKNHHSHLEKNHHLADPKFL
ncbi:uncharacterized protein VP01_326g9 [Puccinia sorghi]|uniref:BED-type domain-containing protein n=1 Tax=Puccinia sorghi TaxID=27349 RepID=A0A0L6UXT7_9BASI|nr:uncharacterized protein VP01_326g9 [Puccinia sorghi]